MILTVLKRFLFHGMIKIHNSFSHTCHAKIKKAFWYTTKTVEYMKAGNWFKIGSSDVAFKSYLLFIEEKMSLIMKTTK